MKLIELITRFSEEEKIGPAFVDTALQYYLPLLTYLKARKENEGMTPLFLGINGSQGSGKSTLAKFLALTAAELFDWRATCLSLDDIYMTKSARQKLGADVHPLFETRGVPGTHDLDLGVATLTGLRELRDGEKLRIPRFDKSTDDQCPSSDWSVVENRQDLVIFEGWCIGCRPQSSSQLEQPLNELESFQDEQGTWRSLVNASISDYQAKLWSPLDLLVMLKAPSFGQVYHWRSEQESKLVDSLGHATELSDPAKMKYFISHYERLTKHMLENLPAEADVVMKLNEDRRIYEVKPELPVFELTGS
jgi:D-glycerate 3-kinase